MTKLRTIKKYSNRRLYDTVDSCYITVKQVRDLVIQGIDIEVVGAKSGEDLTRTVLLQIMQEEESAGKPLFTDKMLAKIIRLYSGTGHGLFARFMEETIEQYGSYQESMQKSFEKQDPFEMVQNNIRMFSDMQAQFFKSTDFGSSTKDDKSNK